jgi:hypothetical protein
MRVHTADSTIAVKIEDVTIEFKPLTYAQRKEVLSCMSRKGGNIIEDRMEMVRIAVRYAIKSVTGLETAEGTYELKKDTDGFLTEGAIDDLMNVQGLTDALTLGSVKIASQGPFTSLENDEGEPLEGVEVLGSGNVGSGSN